MVRTPALLGIALWLLPSVTMAGQTSASFRVGISIGSGKPPAESLAPARTYTWRAAAISVMKAGFGKPQRVGKSGALYWFTAERGGANYRIAVSVTSGAIVKVIPA